MRKLLVIILTGLLLLSCARVGSPIGGDKDTIAPVFLGSNIDTTRVNVPTSLKELRLEFDEYITLKEAVKNLNISPPIKKIKRILPSNLSTKFVLIEWEDDLQPNTTYNFNFGSAIQDNNEANPLPYYNFAFSTGPKIDDLFISGELSNPSKIIPANPPKNRVVGLYKMTDSLNFRQKPYYLTKADDDGYYELNYLAPGNYRIIAFEDENGNSIYEPGKEKIAFQKENVDLQKSISALNLTLAPSVQQVRYKESKEVDGGVLFLFEGKPTTVTMTTESEKLKDFKLTHSPKSDSVRVWFDADAQNVGIGTTDRLEFKYAADTVKGTATAFYRKTLKGEMTIANNESNLLPPSDKLKITSNYFIDRIQPEKWTLTEDSLTTITFDAQISKTNPYQILVSADFKEGKKYQFMVPSKTVSSFYASTAKPYRFDFEADKIQNYGSLEFTIINKPASKFWIQLLDGQEKVKYQTYTNSDKVKFNYLKPAQYFVKMLVDNNDNGYWDLADLATKTFSEDAYVFYKLVNIRPLWENKEDWDLKSTQKLDPALIPKGPVQNQNDKSQNNKDGNNPQRQTGINDVVLEVPTNKR